MFLRSSGDFEPVDDYWLLEDGRVIDPFRPGIESGGFETIEELQKDRAYHLQQVSQMLEQTDLFVFTFGLTEGWVSKLDGAVLPACPGTIGGTFDPDRYAFKNFNYPEVLADAQAFIEMALSKNSAMKFLITVSPVPLTATATDHHVLPATVYSKSVLRAVCGDLETQFDCVDYFPSYELVASHPMRAMYYLPNLRGVATAGVARVMDIFFKAQETDSRENDTPPPVSSPSARELTDDEIVCEEMSLETFNK